eukprot:CAMPEP_0170572442 /NCGR_PEP_ID=MMETSP0224-20130122/2216_1 /TAXON_ID=285029 /ORGANISM="Togula jolla, Strain CCCM 725" /LENGTH=124 /DNA_ID=CAMNT_0010894927 /DNA_START=91 /DNA_END=461 /DNA_ORIENTATION=-
MSVHLSFNPATHTEKVKVVIQPKHCRCTPGDSAILPAVLDYMLKLVPCCLIVDRGHTHHDGSAETCFYLKHSQAAKGSSSASQMPPPDLQPESSAAEGLEPPSKKPRALALRAPARGRGPREGG